MSALQKSSLREQLGIDRLGIIAGAGSLPSRLLAACDQGGIEVPCAGGIGEGLPDEIPAVSLGEVRQTQENLGGDNGMPTCLQAVSQDGVTLA